MITYINFTECEHDEDRRNYISALEKCGAKILSHEHNYSEETLSVRFEIFNHVSFIKQWTETEESEFSDLVL